MRAHRIWNLQPLFRGVGLVVCLFLALGAISPPSTAALSAGKVKKIAKKQIKKLVPGMIDAATIDQGIIPPVTASTTDANKTLFTTGPFTVSLDCSATGGGEVRLMLLVRTSEENSLVNDGDHVIHGEMDPGDGDRTFADYTGDAPGGEAVSDYPYYQVASLRSPSGTHVWVQFDTATNYRGNHCYADGWFLDLAGESPSSSLAAPSASWSLAAPVTTGRVKKIAKKQIKKLVPGMIDAATIDQGIIPPVTASTSDPNVPFLTKGPFTISLDCSLVTGNVRLEMVVRTTEENSVVNGGSGLIGGDLDPADGDKPVASYTGNPPAGQPYTIGMYDEGASIRSPGGTHVYVQFDTVTNFRGNHCYADGWFLDLGADAGTDVKLAATPGTDSALGAPLTTGRVKRIARKQVKKLVPNMVDAATIDQGTISPSTASTADPNKIMLTAGPFTTSLDCGMFMTGVQLKLLVQTSEENTVVSDGAGYINGELDPADGSPHFAEYVGNPPGGDAANNASLFYEYATLRSPSGTHLYAQFDTMTNYQGNHCFADGWFLDLSG